MVDYVVIALTPVETAVIAAESEAEAITKFELSEEYLGMDIMLYAIEADEFYKSCCEDTGEDCEACSRNCEEWRRDD